MTDHISKPFTADDWVERFDEFNFNATFLLGHLQAVEIFIPLLKKIAANAKDFADLKMQLLEFANTQEDFRNDVFLKWESDNPSQYGLPPIEGPF